MNNYEFKVENVKKKSTAIFNDEKKEIESNIELKLENIIGLESVKKELKYYVDFIKNKEKYKKWDVKLPKGILLVGPPGTGKTLLVRTLAKSVSIPVIHMSGSEFVEMYVGVGASRVRNLFKKARAHKDGCIIFIDEIDAVGRKRNGHGGSGGDSERDSTLNQLLVEIDGFGKDDNIMVFGATNLVRNLDPALLRSGRFDKKVYFDPPNKDERIKIFELYLKDIETENICYSKLGELTSSLTGADIANVCNQAKINAIQEDKDKIVMDHIQKAIDEVMIGREKPERRMSEEERRRVSYHEAGHAIMSYILKYTNHPIKVSILPRGENTLGFSQSKPDDKKLYTQDYLMAQICVLLGGRVAEKIMYNNYSSGAYDDIERVTKLTKEWFCSWGMDGNSGAINYDLLSHDNRSMSEDMIVKIKTFVKDMEKFTYQILSQNKDHIVNLGNLLLEKETITYDDVTNILPKELENKIEKIDI
jgi:ATP-dependent metalloprotease FtsH